MNIIVINNTEWHYRYISEEQTHIYTGDPYGDQKAYRSMLLPGFLSPEQIQAILELVNQTVNNTVIYMTALLQLGLGDVLGSVQHTVMKDIL